MPTYCEAHCYQATPKERTAALGLTPFLRPVAPLIWANEGEREKDIGSVLKKVTASFPRQT